MKNKLTARVALAVGEAILSETLPEIAIIYNAL
jgi:hypothetical protein